MADEIAKLQELVNKSSKIVFFGGAGVSTESGIPDFRSKDGLYNSKWKYDPEEILSAPFFEEKPDEFYRFYREKLLIKDVKPNAAHLKLAELEQKGKLLAIITQNIDGLHQAAGSKNVLELHGTIHSYHCSKCNKQFDLKYVEENCDEHFTPWCDSCNGLIKTDVILYGDSLNEEVTTKSIEAIQNADLLIIGGTSLTVYPAAGFINYYNGKDIVMINKDKTRNDNMASLVIHDSIGKVLSQITC